MFGCHIGLCRSNRWPRQHRRRAHAVPHRPSPLSHHCVVYHRQVLAIAPSTTVKLPSRRPSSSITVALAVHCRRAHAIPCPPPLSPSPLSRHRAIHCHPSPSTSIAIESPLHRPLLSLPSSRLLPSRCAPSIAIQHPSPTCCNLLPISLPSLYSLLTDLLKNNSG